MKQILVIEDETDIQEVLKNYLTEEGYRVTLADDGLDGISKFQNGNYQLVLLDIMMPKIDGFTVCEFIRKSSDIPIIMLTALEEEENQIRGLELLADDYITKPFSMPVLLRKIANFLRRASIEETKEETQEIRYRNLKMDLTGHHVFFNNTEVELTQKEFELLHVMLNNLGRVMTRQMLLDQVWGEDYFGEERIVDTHIKNLRKKIRADYIDTIRGVGYRIDKKNKK